MAFPSSGSFVYFVEAYLRTGPDGQSRGSRTGLPPLHGSVRIKALLRHRRDRREGSMERTETIRMVQSDDFESEETRALTDSINNFNMVRTGRTEFYPVVFLLRNEADALRGGIVAYVW